MKNAIVKWMYVLVGLLLLSSCATSQEKALRKAEQSRMVVQALNERNFKINVDRMYPMRGSSRHVSYGYCVEVRNDTLFSYLPYFGRAYNVPYGGGKGLNFDAPIEAYQEYMRKNGLRHIEIGTSNEEDVYLYIIEVFDNGRSTIDVRARERERISYSGDMFFEE